MQDAATFQSLSLSTKVHEWRYLFNCRILYTVPALNEKLSCREENVRLLCGSVQFWSNITGRRYFVDIIGQSSTSVT